MTRRLAISFSGGRTSAYMTKRILDTWRDRYDEIVVLFANTGQEHEKTLEFVHNCDKHFGFNTVWIETNPLEINKGCEAVVVDYKTASRNGTPWEKVVKKHGIYNRASPNCTEALKITPMRQYLRDISWQANTYHTAIGIRADEIDRISTQQKKRKIVYPLIEWNVTKTMVLDWWADQLFDLDLPEHLGNCVWCWKKSDRKLLTIAKHFPDVFDFPDRMESKYGNFKRNGRGGGEYTNVVFFRNNRSAKDIIAASKEPFIEWRPGIEQQQMGLFSLDEMDYTNGCTDSCEVEGI